MEFKKILMKKITRYQNGSGGLGAFLFLSEKQKPKQERVPLCGPESQVQEVKSHVKKDLKKVETSVKERRRRLANERARQISRMEGDFHQVKPRDYSGLGAIALGLSKKAGERFSYGMEVEYRNFTNDKRKINQLLKQMDRNPGRVLAKANLIYSGQYVWLEGNKVVVADKYAPGELPHMESVVEERPGECAPSVEPVAPTPYKAPSAEPKTSTPPQVVPVPTPAVPDKGDQKAGKKQTYVRLHPPVLNQPPKKEKPSTSTPTEKPGRKQIEIPVPSVAAPSTKPKPGEVPVPKVKNPDEKKPAPNPEPVKKPKETVKVQPLSPDLIPKIKEMENTMKMAWLGVPELVEDSISPLREEEITPLSLRKQYLEVKGKVESAKKERTAIIEQINKARTEEDVKRLEARVSKHNVHVDRELLKEYNLFKNDVRSLIEKKRKKLLPADLIHLDREVFFIETARSDKGNDIWNRWQSHFVKERDALKEIGLILEQGGIYGKGGIPSYARLLARYKLFLEQFKVYKTRVEAYNDGIEAANRHTEDRLDIGLDGFHIKVGEQAYQVPKRAKSAMYSLDDGSGESDVHDDAVIKPFLDVLTSFYARHDEQIKKHPETSLTGEHFLRALGAFPGLRSQELPLEVLDQILNLKGAQKVQVEEATYEKAEEDGSSRWNAIQYDYRARMGEEGEWYYFDDYSELKENMLDKL